MRDRLTRPPVVLRFALAALGIAAEAGAGTGPSLRLDLIENTAEGPAISRCGVGSDLAGGRRVRWQVSYGEARLDPGSAWSALRPASGCREGDPEAQSTPLASRGYPYLLADVALERAKVSGQELIAEAALSVRTLTGLAPTGAPVYETRAEKRTVRVAEGRATYLPMLVASAREADEFRVRELLLRLSAGPLVSKSPAEYGEIAVTADVPRAQVFLDGGLVARTSSDGPVVLSAVRAGEREVIVRDASGREARTVAHVGKERRASVSLAIMRRPSAPERRLTPLGRNPQGGEELWREKDGAIVVRIPGGEFQRGSPESEGEASERPRRAVRVDGFLMDKTEVTWGQYRRFVEATRQPPPKPPVWGMLEAFPASGILWDEARAFCAWTGGRLPTEAEWERAARGDGTRRFPWGDSFEPWRCNTRDGGPHAPTPAGDYPDCVSALGVLDLAGSVAEWCSDWYDETYYAKSPEKNPPGPESGSRRVSRGGAWMSAEQWTRVSSRAGVDPAWRGPMQGFRCVQDDPGAERK